MYLGLFDMLAEALTEACETEAEAARRLASLLGRVRSIEGVLRFQLFERRR
ncbi:MAG TPA: hypothetical protein VNO34_10590 [Actinomycetota bacterium]|nr:hypothetical protein [Actinomycetota bacterium]